MSNISSSEIDSKRPIASASVFFFNDTATTEIYTLSLHDALPISTVAPANPKKADCASKYRQPTQSGPPIAFCRGDGPRRRTRIVASDVIPARSRGHDPTPAALEPGSPIRYAGWDPHPTAFAALRRSPPFQGRWSKWLCLALKKRKVAWRET